MPEKTREVFDDDGWFNTGDIVHKGDGDYLWYRGRLSRQKKLDTGKFYSEEKIQAAMDGSNIVSAVVPTGEGRSFVGALIFIDVDGAKELCAGKSSPAPAEELLFYAQNAAVRHAVAETVTKANKLLEPWETVKHWEIVPVVPSVPNGLFTNTQKIRIEEALRRFPEYIEIVHARSRNDDSEHCLPSGAPLDGR